MARQLIFPRPMTCTHIYPDGREERVGYGQYEAAMIVSENGWSTNRTIILIVPYWYVTEVVKENGTKITFDDRIE